jgi:two-component system sensor kinase FixL
MSDSTFSGSLLDGMTPSEDMPVLTGYESAGARGAVNAHVFRVLNPVLAGLAILHLAFVVFDWLWVAPGTHQALTSQGCWGFAVAGVLGALWSVIAARKVPESWAHPISALAACIILGRILDSVRVAGPELTLADPVLFVMGIGCFFLSRGWHAALCTLVMSSWVAVAWNVTPSRDWTTAATFQFLSAIVLSVLVNEVRLRTFSKFVRMHALDRQTKSDLRRAIEWSEASKVDLRRNHQMMNCVLENMPVVVFRVDGQGIMRESFGAGAGKSGLPNRGIGLSAFASYPNYADYLRRALAGESVRVEVEGVGPDGFWCYECFLTPDVISGSGCVGFAIDSTERRTSERERRRRSHFDKLLTQTTARFLASQTDEVDSLIEESLRKAGEFLEVDFACLWRPSEQEDAEELLGEGRSRGLPQLFRWDSAEAPPIYATPLNEALELAAGLTERLSASPMLVLDLTTTSDPLLAKLTRCGLQSFVGVAVGPADAVEGFVGFGSRRKSYVDISGLDGLLRVFGDVCFSLMHRAEAERQSRHLASQIQQVMDHSPTIIFIKDRHGKFLFVNRRHEEIFHIPNREIRKLGADAILPKDLVAEVERVNQEVLETGVPQLTEELVPQSDGDHSYLSVRFALKDADGKPYAMCGMATDITERKREAEAARKTENLLNAVMQHSSAMVFIKDCEGKYLFINRWHEESFQLRNSEVQGKTDFDFLAPEVAEAVRAHDQTVIEHGGPLTLEEVVPINGRPHTFIVEKFPLRDAHNEIYAVCGIATDITELRDAELKIHALSEQLDQVSRMGVLGEMGAGIAHELHQPLFAMANFAKAAIRKHKSRRLTFESACSSFERIASQAMRAGEIVTRIRSFVTKRGFRLKRTDVNAVIDDALILVRMSARDHDVSLTVRKDPDVPTIMADPVQISQVLVNLALNSIQALSEVMDRPRTLVLETLGWRDGGVEILVADNGPGISEDIRERLFDQFVTTKPNGMGLGLPMSRSIVETHGGTLDPESVPGGGCLFRVTLPASPPDRNLESFGESGSGDEIPQFDLLDPVEDIEDDSLSNDELETVHEGEI